MSHSEPAPDDDRRRRALPEAAPYGVPDHRTPDGPGRSPGGPEVHQTGPGQPDGSDEDPT